MIMEPISEEELKLLNQIQDENSRIGQELLRQAVGEIWGAANPRIIKGYTDHGLPHSQRLAGYAGKLLAENNDRPLSPKEMYLLLAGIYLHDIGMQCDVTMFPEIKKQAEQLGAVFEVSFTAPDADNYSIEEQKEIRKNHQYLSAAWIEYAQVSGKSALGPAAKKIPKGLVGDLMEVCKYHSHLPIYDCPIQFKHDRTERLQLVAALLRFADELDIDANRVSIETVKNFTLDPRHSIYWWMHHCTNVNLDQNLVHLKIILHPDDAKDHGDVIHTAVITEFEHKNRPVVDILVKHRIPIVFSRDSGVEEDKFYELLPPEIVAELHKMQETYDPRHPVFFVPFKAKGDQLIGRHEALGAVHRELSQGRRTAIGQAVAFQGLGGLGKTQLAVEYAYRYREHYPNGVIWLNADQDLDAQLIELAEKARWIAPESEHHYKLEVAAKRLRTFSDCLIIFDNLESREAIAPYLPEPQTDPSLPEPRVDPHILITSRTEQPGFTPLPLALLDDDLSLKMLVQEANRQPDTDEERQAAQDIASALGGLPLALELAGAYLRHRPVGWQEYRDLLQQNLQAALPARFLDSLTKHETELYSTLKLNETIFQDEPLLKDILDLLAWSGPAPMGWDFMGALLHIQDTTQLTHALLLGEALHLLKKTPQTASYALHRLVRAVGREIAPLAGRQDWVAGICQRLGDWFQARRDDFADLPQFEAEIDHLRAWQENALDYAPLYAPRLIWLQAYPHYHRGRYREAQEQVTKALKLYEAREHPDLALKAHLLNDLGYTYGHLGDYGRHLKYCQKALEIRLEVLGGNHPDTAQSLNNVGAAYGEIGDYNHQLEYFQKALAIRLEVLGEHHPETAQSLNNVGAAYWNLSDYGRQLEYFQKALDIYQKLLGERHPNTANSFNNIGTAYGELGDYGRQLEYYQKALSIRQEVLGERHPDTASSFSNLGAAYGNLGDYGRQLEYSPKALAIRQEVLGERHPGTADSLNNVGAAYGELSDYGRELEYYQKALAIRQEVLGERHPDTASSLNNVGSAFGNLGDHRRQLEYFQKALAIFQEVLGERHPVTATSLNNVGAAYGKLGEGKIGREYMAKALQLRRESLGDLHPATIKSADHLASMLFKSGRQHPALALLNEFLAKISHDHPLYQTLTQSKNQILAQTPGFRKPPKQGKKKKKKKH
jgi:tetratricopeptide (TPR) repeat protein